MKEWCEKAREENTESRRKSVSQEGERGKESSVESNTAGKECDTLQGNAEQEDQKNRTEHKRPGFWSWVRSQPVFKIANTRPG